MAAIQQGHAELRVGCVRGQSSVLRACARNPLRLLTPRSCGPSVWAYTSSFGGGLVTGDLNHVQITVDRDARCFFSTQSATKIYKSIASASCTQIVQATVSDNSLLILAPDPVQPFAEARYRQEQTFQLAPSANLVLVDWLSAGRTARGERWAFAEYSSRNEIFVAGKRILADALLLDSHTANLRMTTGGYNCLGTVVVIGPALLNHSGTILQRVSEMPAAPEGDVVISASPLSGGVIMRLAGRSVEGAGLAIHSFLSFVPTLLSDNPWARKW